MANNDDLVMLTPNVAVVVALTDLRPNDVLVVKIPNFKEVIACNGLERAKEYVRLSLPPGVEVLLLPLDAEVSVVRPIGPRPLEDGAD